MNTKQLKTIIDNHFRLVKSPIVPILECVYFNNGKAIYTDLETWVEQAIDVRGIYCYDRYDLKALCIAHPNTEIDISEEGIWLPNGKLYKIERWDAEEFPKIPVVNYGGLLLTPYAQAKLRELVPMVNTDRPFPVLHMQHIYLDKGTAVATNSNIMGWREGIGLGELCGFIPTSFFPLLDKKAEYSIIFQDAKEEETKVDEDIWCHIWNKDLSLKWRYSGRKFPNWKSVMPDFKESIKIHIPTAKLINFLKKVLELAKIHKQTFTYVKIEPTRLIWENLDFEQELIEEIELGEFATFALDVKSFLNVLDSSIYSTELDYDRSTYPIRVNGVNVIMPLALDKLK